MNKKKIKLIKDYIDLIKSSIETGVSINQVCIKNGKSRKYISDGVRRIKNLTLTKTSDIKLRDELLDLYSNYLNTKQVKTVKDKSNVEYDAFTDDSYDERSYGDIVRGGDEITLSDGVTITNKITGYYYNIKIANQPDLIGELTREEMDMVYRLYSNMDGAGLTQRVVSRHFRNLTFPNFKRILRAFNITKSSLPVAPHILEEGSLPEVVDIIFRNKENNLFKKIEEDRSKQTEKILIETQKELVETKGKIKYLKDLVSDTFSDDIKSFKIEYKHVENEYALIVYLSDMHVGAKTQEDSLYDNEYNENEFNHRLTKTIGEVLKQYKIFGRFDKIIICNLGDSLDGYNSETTRGGHSLPQNMGNKEQFNVYVKGIVSFFNTLYESDIANNIEYMCVGDANHDGDFGYIANRAIQIYLDCKYPDMNVKIFEKFIEHFDYGMHTFILSHGKDKEDKVGGFPLNLNEKTENYFNDYLYNKNITNENIHIVSGDLHQTSINHAKRFRYKKVSSLYGSSKWIHTNFGNTRPAVDYEVVTKNDSTILEGRLKL